MIEIRGLSKRQMALADILWGMNGREEVTAFISSLQGKTRQEAEVVLEMMLWAIWDDVAEIQQETIDLVDSFRI
jgi:hypothetical protein